MVLQPPFRADTQLSIKSWFGVFKATVWIQDDIFKKQTCAVQMV
jgi:hypothetical protein